MKRLLITANLVLGVWVAPAQVTIHFYGARQGLSQNSVNKVFKDHHGLLWIGTQDGLNRFDGSNFRVYRHDPEDSSSISDQYITSMMEDSIGQLWIGTRNGLNLYDPRMDRFRRIYPDPSARRMVQNQAYLVGVSREGKLVVAMAGHAYLVDPLTTGSQRIDRDGVDPDNMFLMDGEPWMLWNKSHICRVGKCPVTDHGTIEHRTRSDLPEDVLYFDGRGRIWYTLPHTEHRTIVIHDIRKHQWDEQEFHLPASLTDISFDKSGEAWISTMDGIYRMEGRTGPIRWEPSMVDLSGKILCTLPDDDGITWIGTAERGLGLHGVSKGLFRYLKPDASNQAVFFSCLERNGDILFGGPAGIYLNNGTGPVRKSPVRCTSAASDAKGNLWVALPGKGLQVRDRRDRSLARYTKAGGQLPSDDVFHIRYDIATGRMFIATKSGLVVHGPRDDEWNTINDASDPEKRYRLTGTYVMHTCTDPTGATWVSTNLGVDVLDRDLHPVLRIPSGADSDRIQRTIITSVSAGAAGTMWISTLSNGIYSWHDGMLEHFDVKRGLKSNICYGSATDRQGRVWIATGGGVAMLDPRTGRIRNFSEEDGVVSTDFGVGSINGMADGTLHMGTTDGLLVIDPDRFQARSRSLKVYVNEIQVNHETVPNDSTLVLGPEARTVSFSFAAPAFFDAGQVIHQYRLKGFDGNWITLKPGDRRATFTNLPFSTYVLELRAAFELSELAGAEVSRVRLVMDPPVWKSPMFIFAATFALFLLIFGAARLYARARINARLRETELEQTIFKERERISRDLHDQLGAYAASIKNSVVQMQRTGDGPSVQLTQLKENAEEMVMALRETIWALQNASISATSLSDRFKEVVKRISALHPDRGITYKERISVDVGLKPGEGIHLMRILQESLTNALRHSGCNAIVIQFLSDRDIVLTIEDDGKGFDPGGSHDGYGLQNMRQRANEAGLDLTMNSDGSGTRIEVRIVR